MNTLPHQLPPLTRPVDSALLEWELRAIGESHCARLKWKARQALKHPYGSPLVICKLLHYGFNRVRGAV